MQKPTRNFWQIWNMSFGFVGIPFGWGLQMANMSAIYEYLGAQAHQIPLPWLAAALLGLPLAPGPAAAPDPVAVARRAAHGPARAAGDRAHERPDLGPPGASPALLPGGS